MFYEKKINYNILDINENVFLEKIITVYKL